MAEDPHASSITSSVGCDQIAAWSSMTRGAKGPTFRSRDSRFAFPMKQLQRSGAVPTSSTATCGVSSYSCAWPARLRPVAELEASSSRLARITDEVTA
jgi:hypothetical protein